jgi:hypothetical protein
MRRIKPEMRRLVGQQLLDLRNGNSIHLRLEIAGLLYGIPLAPRSTGVIPVLSLRIIEAQFDSRLVAGSL